MVQTVVARGANQTITGSGWYPGESVHLTVNSSTLDLGTVTAASDGTLAVTTFVVPADFASGTHTVSAVGSVSGTRQVTFEVTASAGPSASPTGSTGISAGTGGSTAPTSAGGLMVAVVALLAGVAVLVLRRRVGHHG